MQIEIKIDEKCKEPKIIVMTDKMTDEVNAIIKRLSDEQPQVIAGFREDVVEVLEPSEIYRVFAVCQLLPIRTGGPNRMFMIILKVRSLLTRTKRAM